MARDVNDPSNFEARMQSQLNSVRELDHEADSNAILRWARSQDVAANTLKGRLNCAKKLAQRSDVPLVEMAQDDLLNVLSGMAHGHYDDVPDDGLADGTLRQYRQAAKLFFRDELDREWAEDIKIGTADPTPIGPGDILMADEVDALLDACRDPRDSALIAFLVVTGQRITAALSIRLKDVKLTERTGTIRLNDDAVGLKGASGPRPLLWARPYVARWLDSHPEHPDNQDAPLFCATQSGERPREDGGTVSWEIGDPISRTQASNRLKDVAERADVPREKVNPHTFRHTAITRMRDQGVGDDRIRFMVGVAPDSDILERYDKATNDKMMRRIRDHHDIPTDEGASVGRPSLTECPSCASPLRDTASFCPGCGTPLDAGAADRIDEVDDQTVEEAFAADDPDWQAVFRGLRQAAKNNPEVREALLSELRD